MPSRVRALITQTSNCVQRRLKRRSYHPSASWEGWRAKANAKKGKKSRDRPAAFEVLLARGSFAPETATRTAPRDTAAGTQVFCRCPSVPGSKRLTRRAATPPTPPSAPPPQEAPTNSRSASDAAEGSDRFSLESARPCLSGVTPLASRHRRCTTLHTRTLPAPPQLTQLILLQRALELPNKGANTTHADGCRKAQPRPCTTSSPNRCLRSPQHSLSHVRSYSDMPQNPNRRMRLKAIACENALECSPERRWGTSSHSARRGSPATREGPGPSSPRACTRPG
jgi:hypothetical protein